MEDSISTLRQLGLTILQAKVYITLVKSNALTVTEISNLSKIQRTDLYSVLKELEEKGLVEREVAHPMAYHVVHFDQVLDHLLRRKEEEHVELRRKVTGLRQSFQTMDKFLVQREKAKLRIVPRIRITNRIKTAIETAEETIDVIILGRRFSKRVVFFHDEIKKSFSRGVRWRIITEKPQEKNDFWNQMHQLNAEESCRIRILEKFPRIISGIYDRKEVMIFETATEEIKGSSALWTNNRTLVLIATDYFEKLWRAAGRIELNPKKGQTSKG